MKKVLIRVELLVERFVQDDVPDEVALDHISDEVVDKFRGRLLFSHCKLARDEDSD